MIKSNDSRLHAPSPHEGVQVVPDELVLPIRLRAQGKDPLKVASALAEDFQGTQNAVGALEPSRYRSWTEKLVGKSFGGHGVRYHAEALVLIRRALGDADFFTRVQMLETLRANLAPLDDGSLLTVGVAKWCVSNTEIHRNAALQLHKARIDAACETLGVAIEEVDGSHELVVTSVSPVVAYVQLNLTTKFSSVA